MSKSQKAGLWTIAFLDFNQHVLFSCETVLFDIKYFASPVTKETNLGSCIF